MKEKHRLHDANVDLMRKYNGGPWTSSMPNGNCIINLGDNPASVEHVLKTNFQNYEMSPKRKAVLRDLLGDGIFLSDGKKWHLQRKAAASLFTVRNLRDAFSPAIRTHGRELVAKLLATPAGKTVDVQDLLFRFTLDTFCEIAFGESVNCQAEEVPFHKAFDRVQMLNVERMLDPLWYIKKLLGVGRERIIAEDLKVLNAFSAAVIARRRKDLADGVERNDLISGFLKFYAKEGEEDLSDDDLRDIILNFLVAGRDTTAVLMTWILKELSDHPDVEEKAYDEVMRVCGDREPEYADATNMPYLKSVAWEALRLHPSVPSDGRCAIHEDTLPDGTRVPAGAICVYSPYAMGRSKKLWGDDAEEFKPSRWGDVPKEVSQYTMPAFNAGPRLCLGKSLAFIEALTVIAMIIKSCRLKTLPGPVEYVVTVTLPVKNGLPVTVVPRD